MGCEVAWGLTGRQEACGALSGCGWEAGEGSPFEAHEAHARPGLWLSQATLCFGSHFRGGL